LFYRIVKINTKSIIKGKLFRVRITEGKYKSFMREIGSKSKKAGERGRESMRESERERERERGRERAKERHKPVRRGL
jgi:PHD/YefM family antitoxin component YafN of YafNO toxin-antitoxin module